MNKFLIHIDDERKNYLHYVKLLGEPTLLTYENIINRMDPPKSAHSYSLMLIASRYGMKIHGDDSDLAWIPYLVLTTSLPPAFDKNLRATTHKDKIIQRLCYMKFGEHPGDYYFSKVIEKYSAKRSENISKMTSDEVKSYKSCRSWLKFKYDASGLMFFFNMLTKEKSEFLPSYVKTNLQKFVDKEKQAAISLVTALLEEHDAREVTKEEEKASEVLHLFSETNEEPLKNVIKEETLKNEKLPNLRHSSSLRSIKLSSKK